MIEYALKNNQNFVPGRVDAETASNKQDIKSFKNPFEQIDYRGSSNQRSSDISDITSLSAMNIQDMIRAMERLMAYRQEPEQLFKEITRVFVELFGVDGAWLFESATGGAIKPLACYPNLLDVMQAEQMSQAGEDQNNPLNPAVLFPFTDQVREYTNDLSTEAKELFSGVGNYRSTTSLPLICNETMVCEISLLSNDPFFFIPERVNVFRCIAYFSASLLRSAFLRKVLEKEQAERKILQGDIQKLREKMMDGQGSMEASAETVTDELETLSYSISHDLRAPLRAIQHNCMWLKIQQSANPDTEENTMTQQIAASAEQMEKLLDGLLAFSKVVKCTPRYSSIDMTVIANAVIDELMAYEGNSPSLTIILNPLQPACGDVTLIRQVWYNLLSNAFKFTRYKQKREVEISACQSDGFIVYCVRDNGTGFDMQYADRLFNAFQRLHEVMEFEGTGIGLAIVHRIIQRHGGRVWAESTVDNGARFYFTLPKA